MGLNEELNSMQPIPYKTFEGRYIDAMPALRAQGRMPITFKQFADKVIELVEAHPEDEPLVYRLLENYVDFPDAVAFCDDEVKIIPNCEYLINISPDAELKRGVKSNKTMRSGALVLADNQYSILQGKKFQRSDLKLNERLTRQEAKEDLILQAELEDLVEPFVDLIFNAGKKKHNCDKMMGIYLADTQDVPTLRALCLDRLYYGSYLYCNGLLVVYGARLVGVLDQHSNAKTEVKK